MTQTFEPDYTFLKIFFSECTVVELAVLREQAHTCDDKDSVRLIDEEFKVRATKEVSDGNTKS